MSPLLAFILGAAAYYVFEHFVGVPHLPMGRHG